MRRYATLREGRLIRHCLRHAVRIRLYYDNIDYSADTLRQPLYHDEWAESMPLLIRPRYATRADGCHYFAGLAT